MADTNSDLITAFVAARTGLSAGIVNGDDNGGILTFYNVEVAIGASPTADDTFQLINLPPGAVLVPEMCSISTTADPGTTLTMDVGDAGDPDRYCDGANLGALSAAGIVLFTAPVIPSAVFTPYRDNDDVTRIYATAKTVGTNTACTLKFSLVARIKG